MNYQNLRLLLEKLSRGEIAVDEVLERLRRLPFEDLGSVRVDHHRGLRKHFPEIIYGPGKTVKELQRIISSFLEKGIPLLITRVEKEKALALRKSFTVVMADTSKGACGESSAVPVLEYHERARLLGWHPQRELKGRIVVVAAGTADLPVAEEARIAAEYFGNYVETVYDVGVAGIHRLFPDIERLRRARAVIVVAGMEGALPSVVASLVDRPVIAVPTSVGYGAHFGGVAPLLTMLNTCSMGIAVVNIDNGVGAAYFASMINHMLEGENGQKRS